MSYKLYYDSAYTSEWTTEIERIEERPDGAYALLKETAFYPHGGGQPCDTGSIGGIAVTDVIQEGEQIMHKLERLPAAPAEVKCRLDWSRRYDHMQQHSGQHLLSAVVLRLTGAATLSFHLGEEYATIDVDLRELPTQLMLEAELAVNEEIYRNRRIPSYFVSREQAARLSLVKAPGERERIRIVEIEGIEYNACGGTHVLATGELGILKLLKAERQKGNIRIYFKAGKRALLEFGSQQRILQELSARYKTSPEDLPGRLAKQDDELRAAQAELASLREQNETYWVRDILLDHRDAPVTLLLEDKSLKELQSLAVKLAEACGYPALLASASENKAVLARPAGSSLSCGAFFKTHLGSFGGRGGGSDALAQAGFETAGQMRAFFDFAADELTKG